MQAATIFKNLDRDGDQFLSLIEATESFENDNTMRGRGNDEQIPAWFTEMDMNRDGKISPSEFDRDLKDY